MFHPEGPRGAQKLARRLVRSGDLPAVDASIAVIRKEVRLSPTVAQVLEAIDRLAEEAPAFGECERAAGVLLERLRSEKNPEIKETLVRALGRLTEPVAIPALRELVGHPKFGDAAEKAIELIEEQMRKPNAFKTRMRRLREQHDLDVARQRGRGE